MRKAVLISIQPKWCELIASGKKTVEVRKSRPKIDTPFKCYIYCTNDRSDLWVLRERLRKFYGDKIASLCNAKDVGGATKANGKVIGEFTCDKITCYPYNSDGYGIKKEKELCADSGLKTNELYHYLQGSKPYAWHISDLKVYDKPKELSEFNAICPYKKPEGTRMNVDCPCDKYTWDFDEKTGKSFCTRRITRPPQSWCYVEEREENA